MLLVDLQKLGIELGDTVLVQGSLRALGRYLTGSSLTRPGPDRSAALLTALLTAIGPTGTLVAYTATPENSDTSRLHLAATAGMTPDQLSAFREAMPPFDPDRTPASPSVGRIPEAVRTAPGAIRSTHPQTSFAAIGPKAAELMANHDRDCHLGEQSPLARMYEAGARVLLVGVSLASCTALHLADYRAAVRTGHFPERHYSCKVLDPDGSERWKSFKDLDLDDQHFSKLADDVAPLIKQHLRDGFLATARCLLLPIKEAVDAAVEVAVEKAGKKPPAEAPEPPVDAKPAAASPQVDVS